MTLISVDLPAPFSPRSAWTSPGVEGERDVVERLRGVEALRDPGELEERHLRRARPRSSRVRGGHAAVDVEDVAGGLARAWAAKYAIASATSSG